MQPAQQFSRQSERNPSAIDLHRGAHKRDIGQRFRPHSGRQRVGKFCLDPACMYVECIGRRKIGVRHHRTMKGEHRWYPFDSELLQRPTRTGDSLRTCGTSND
ncbi:hypothetical protein D3C81_2047850 [compost metagenome]